MLGKELPLAPGPEGKAELHYPGVFKLCARGAEKGSLERVMHFLNVGDLSRVFRTKAKQGQQTIACK